MKVKIVQIRPSIRTLYHWSMVYIIVCMCDLSNADVSINNTKKNIFFYFLWFSKPKKENEKEKENKIIELIDWIRINLIFVMYSKES